MILYCDAAGDPAGYGLPFNVLDECSGTVTSTIRYISIAGVVQGTTKPAAWSPCTTCCPTQFSEVLCYTDPGTLTTRSIQVVTSVDQNGTVTVATYEMDGTPLVPTPAAANIAVCSSGGSGGAWVLTDGTTPTIVDTGDAVTVSSLNANLKATVGADSLTLDYDLCADVADSFTDANRATASTDQILARDSTGACVLVDPATGDNYVAKGTVNPTVAITGADTYVNTTDGSRWEWQDTDADGVGDTWVAVSTAVTLAPDDGAGCTTNGIESLGTGLWVDPNPVHVVVTDTLPQSLVSDRGASFWFGPATHPMPLPGATNNIFRSHMATLNLGNADPGSFLSTTDASRLGSTSFNQTTDESYIFVAVITSGGDNGPGAVSLETTTGNTEGWRVLGSLQHPDYGFRHTVMWTRPSEFGANVAFTVQAALAVWAYAATIEIGFISGAWSSDPFQGWDAGYSQNGFAPVSAAATAYGNQPGPVVVFASGHDYPEADINNFGPFIRETGGTFTQFGADGYAVTQSNPGNFASLFAVDDAGFGAPEDSGQLAYRTEQNAAQAMMSVARVRRRVRSNETLLRTLNLPGAVNPACNPTMQEVLTITTVGYGGIENLDMLLNNGDWLYAYLEVDGTFYPNLGQLDLSRSTAEAMQIAFPSMTAVYRGPTVAPGATGPTHTIRIWIGSQGRSNQGLDSYMLVPGLRATSELVHI